MNSEVALLILSLLPLSAGVLLSRVRVRQSLFLSFLSFLVSETTMDEVVLAAQIGILLSGSLVSNQDVGERREGVRREREREREKHRISYREYERGISLPK